MIRTRCASVPVRALRTPLRLFGFLLLLGLLIPLAGTGCAPGGFGSNISVPEDASKALADGAAKEKAAEAAGVKDADEADRLRTENAAYYGAVAHKFKGGETGIQALLAQGRLLDTPHGHPQAQAVYRDALRTYTVAAFPELHAQAQARYDDLIARMDRDNAKTPYYKVMDGLVRLVGGSHVLAILVISLGLTLLLWPLRLRQYRGMKEMQRHAPELKKIQEKYKDDRPLQMEKVQEFYREHGFNPLAGCLPVVAQMPILWGVYYAISLYQFRFVHATFLWINPAAAAESAKLALPFPLEFLKGAIAPDLSQQDLPLLFAYALSMFVQTRLTPPSDPTQAEQQKIMSVVMPVMFFVMMLQWHMPSAFVLYWFLSNVFSVSQQWWILRSIQLPPLPAAAISGAGPVSAVVSAAPTASGGGDARALAANKRIVSPKNRRRVRKK